MIKNKEKKIKKELITVNIDDLKPYSNNMNKGTNVEQLKILIKEYGYQDRIEVDENLVILVGHSRAKALKSLGYTDIEVVKISGYTDKEKKAYRIKNNLVKRANIIDEANFITELKEVTQNGDNLQDFFGIDLDNIMGVEKQNNNYAIYSNDDVTKEQDRLDNKFTNLTNGVITKYLECPHCNAKIGTNINDTNF